MKKTAGELAVDLAEALEELKGKPEADLRLVWNALYSVDPRLSGLIAKMASHIAKPSKDSTRKAGPLLEQIALVAFAGLNGYPNLQAFRSATSQHDLLVSGDGQAAAALCKLVRISGAQRGILVECKAEKAKVGDPEMRRLCAMVNDHFPTVVGLGVFLTLKGATGYSTAGREVRRIGDARLTQVISHARSSKPIVVLDWADIQMLTNPGSLPFLLKQRIEELEKLGAIFPAAAVTFAQVDLPAHLAELHGTAMLPAATGATASQKTK
jgi:hypothetical protein